MACSKSKLAPICACCFAKLSNCLESWTIDSASFLCSDVPFLSSDLCDLVLVSATEGNSTSLDSIDTAIAASPIPFRNCPRVRPVTVPPAGKCSVPKSSPTSPDTRISCQVAIGPRKRLRLTPSHQLVQARTLLPSTSKRVGTQGVSLPKVFSRHSCTRGSRRLMTSSLSPTCPSIRSASSEQVKHPPSKPSTSLLLRASLSVSFSMRSLPPVRDLHFPYMGSLLEGDRKRITLKVLFFWYFWYYTMGYKLCQ
jgi:hypothetical protein